MEDASSSPSFLGRHQFLIYRLFSLCGLIPVGGYLVIHLATNALILKSPAAFQDQVYTIHSLPLLTVVEWTFIFIPILFHAAIGLWIAAGGLPNASSYPYPRNIRYVMQRATGMIAFLFILWHVFHMHGWLHWDPWLETIRGDGPFNGAKFRPYNAASTAGEALQYPLVILFYVVGVLSAVFHLANGIWTAGITWGLWTGDKAQHRAAQACAAFGILLGCVGLGSIWGMYQVGLNPQQAIEMEDAKYNTKLESHDIEPNPEKRTPDPAEEGESEEDDSSAEEQVAEVAAR